MLMHPSHATGLDFDLFVMFYPNFVYIPASNALVSVRFAQARLSSHYLLMQCEPPFYIYIFKARL